MGSPEHKPSKKSSFIDLFRGGNFDLVSRGLPMMRQGMWMGSFAINLLMLALPLVVLQVYDRIIPNQAFSTLTLLILGVITAVLIDIVLKSSRSYLSGWAGAHFEHKVGVEGIKRIMETDATRLESEPPGTHLDRLGGVDKIRDFYASQAGLILVDLPFVLIFIGVIAYIAKWLALIPLVLFFVFGSLALLIGNYLRRALKERMEWDNRRYSFIIEVLSGVHTIKSIAMERLFQRRYERLMASCAESGMAVAYLSGAAQNLGSTYSQVSQVLVVGAGSLLVINGELTAGGLAASMLLAGRTVQPILRALGLWARFQSIQIAQDQLNEISQYERRDLEAVQLGDEEQLTRIKLNNATFRYRHDLPPIIKNVNLEVKKGEIIAIRGTNGSGKTTFLRLLMGSIPPSEGSLMFNNQDAHAFRQSHLQSQIAFLPQKPILFEGTVVDNLTMFRGKDLLDDALKIANSLGLDKVFARFPDGFDTKVGSTTHAAIPAGVSQRIAIARALVNKPKLILFDEANNALDGPGDARLVKVLQQFTKHSAIVLVSYRPSILKIADRRFDLVNGELLPYDPNRDMSNKANKLLLQQANGDPLETPPTTAQNKDDDDFLDEEDDQ